MWLHRVLVVALARNLMCMRKSCYAWRLLGCTICLCAGLKSAVKTRWPPFMVVVKCNTLNSQPTRAANSPRSVCASRPTWVHTCSWSRLACPSWVRSCMQASTTSHLPMTSVAMASSPRSHQPMHTEVLVVQRQHTPSSRQWTRLLVQ